MKIYVDGSKRAAVSRMFSVWKQLGYEVTNDAQKSDVQLSVIQISNKPKVPVVLRLDGIYYDKAENYNKRNFLISKSHARAEAVVYQSNLCKIMCEKYLAKRNGFYNIIYNGVNPDEWKGFQKHNNINIVTCCKWRRHKRLPETIEIFDTFLKTYPTAILHIVGPMKRGARVINHKNVIYHNPNQKIGFEEIRKIYQNCDIYLSLAKRDPCPSSIVEAIAAGMPVITSNFCGGSTEMCSFTSGCYVIPGDIESYEPDYIYRDPYNSLPKVLKSRILKRMIKLAENKHRVKLPEKLNIEHTAKKYLEVMETLLK
jgi:glycosyltransferase involved in cell wall biosynthesis